MKGRLIAAAALGLMVAAGASAQTRKTQAENLERFQHYAGEPVDQFEFWNLYKWQLVGPTKVVIWPRINEAYLVTVDDPCPSLEWSKGIGVTSQQSHLVSRKFDYVTTGKDQCKIAEIRPIDYPRMLKDGPDKRS